MVDTREIHQAPLLKIISELESQLTTKSHEKLEILEVAANLRVELSEQRRKTNTACSQLATAQEHKDLLLAAAREDARVMRELIDKNEEAQARVRELEAINGGCGEHFHPEIHHLLHCGKRTFCSEYCRLEAEQSNVARSGDKE